MNNYPLKNLLLGLVGAAIGGVVGYFLTDWAQSQGFVALVVPGGAVGLGFGLAARKRHISFGVIGAVLAAAAGFFTDWKLFENGLSISEYFQQLPKHSPIVWLMLAVGVWLGFSWAHGRPSRYRNESSAKG